MGAATAILYGAIDPRCRAVFAVAPYRDAPEVARAILPAANDQQYQAAWDEAGQIAHFDPRDTSVISAVKTLRCPLVIVHGKLDMIVPYEHGKSLFEAAPRPKRLITKSLAGHASILLLGPAWFADQFDALARGQMPME
jgi:fermentation-respiration switch protein FrsA (DUF1100 family)